MDQRSLLVLTLATLALVHLQVQLCSMPHGVGGLARNLTRDEDLRVAELRRRGIELAALGLGTIDPIGR